MSTAAQKHGHHRVGEEIQELVKKPDLSMNSKSDVIVDSRRI